MPHCLPLFSHGQVIEEVGRRTGSLAGERRGPSGRAPPPSAAPARGSRPCPWLGRARPGPSRPPGDRTLPGAAGAETIDQAIGKPAGDPEQLIAAGHPMMGHRRLKQVPGAVKLVVVSEVREPERPLLAAVVGVEVAVRLLRGLDQVDRCAIRLSVSGLDAVDEIPTRGFDPLVRVAVPEHRGLDRRRFSPGRNEEVVERVALPELVPACRDARRGDDRLALLEQAFGQRDVPDPYGPEPGMRTLSGVDQGCVHRSVGSLSSPGNAIGIAGPRRSASRSAGKTAMMAYFAKYADMYYMFPRRLEAPRASFFLLGPRGTGKSTWVRSAMPNAVYVDLLDEARYQAYLADPALFGSELRAVRASSWVVLDEIQRLPSLLNEVHRAIEERRLKFALTGSSARKLRRGGTNLLGGRARELGMFPFVPEELGAAFRLETALRQGTLPLVCDAEEPEQTLAAYVQTYLKEEIQAEALARNLGGFARFLPVAA